MPDAINIQTPETGAAASQQDAAWKLGPTIDETANVVRKHNMRVVSLPRRIARRVSALLSRIQGKAAVVARRMAFRSEVLASLYYLCFSSAFRREQQACLAGLRAYAQLLARADGESITLLRRNVHRLEKGMIMRPRRDVFATEYIQETVACLKKVLRVRGGRAVEPGSELQWALDVLAKYFSIVAADPTVDAARLDFQHLSFSTKDCCGKLVPYRRDLEQPLQFGIDELLALAQRRRSVRWFLEQRVPREMIDEALAVAAQSPSACNRQPFVFHVLDDPELVRRAAVIPMGTAGYAHNIPVFVVIVGQQRNYFDERDRHLIYIDGALAAMGLVYALEVQGLSSCCINWPDIEERERRMAKLLKLEPDERPVMCMAIGFPDPEGMVPCSQKKPVDQLRQFNLE